MWSGKTSFTHSPDWNLHCDGKIKQLTAFDTSSSLVSCNVKICDAANTEGQDNNEQRMQHVREIVPGGTFVACIYDRKPWIGIIKEKSDEHDDNVVSFMTPSDEAN